ncbi:hypothetical protein GCM10027568_05810 [Humibacter soli]
MKTKAIGHERAADSLDSGHSVVVDDTGSPRFLRDELRELAAEHDASCAVVWVRISPELQRERVLANRADGSRHDVIDEVLDDHVASFEEPIHEDPIVIDANDTRNPLELAHVVTAIRTRT